MFIFVPVYSLLHLLHLLFLLLLLLVTLIPSVSLHRALIVQSAAAACQADRSGGVGGAPAGGQGARVRYVTTKATPNLPILSSTSLLPRLAQHCLRFWVPP